MIKLRSGRNPEPAQILSGTGKNEQKNKIRRIRGPTLLHYDNNNNNNSYYWRV